MSIALQLLYELLHVCYEFGIELSLKSQYLIFRTQYLVFVFLQFLSDVALSLCQGLLANPVRRHVVLIGVAHLEVVAEDVVVAYLQRCNAGVVYFALLNLQQVVLTRESYLPEFVKLWIHTTVDYVALADHCRWVGHEPCVYMLTQFVEGIKFLPYPFQHFGIRLHAYHLDRLYGCQG